MHGVTFSVIVLSGQYVRAESIVGALYMSLTLLIIYALPIGNDADVCMTLRVSFVRRAV